MISQAWLNELPKSKTNYNYHDYCKAFDDYWKPFNVDNSGYYSDNGVKKKAAGWKQFKRWAWAMEGQVDPETGAFPSQSAIEVYNNYVQANGGSQTSIGSNPWSSLGTNSSTGGYAGIGRVSCIAFHPTNNNIYWVGAPAGGLWKTTNNGSTWTCLTDSNNVLGVSSIIIPSDYATSNTIYIGTGDRDAWDNRSIGVLKSTDGGATWNTTGLSYTLAASDMVNKLLISPTNNNTLIAATSNGVFKTTNGGTTWSTMLTSTNFIDLEYKPNNFNTLYGSTKYGKVYVSTNGGSNWSQKLNTGYRIELAVTPASSGVVYAIVASSNNGLHGIYKSTNSGSSFTSVYSSTNLLGWKSNGSDSGGQGWYDLSMAASPTNANIVLIGGVNSHKSTNGGSAWSCSNCWTSYSGYNSGNHPEVHADKHNLVYRSNGDLFECNDGGVYISTNNGSTWTDKSNGLVISQMYKLSTSKTVSTETITGLQDNGTKLLSAGSWTDVKGGDGMECLIDYTDVNIQYGTYTNGQISRTTNHWSSSTDITPSGATSGAWVTPYIIDPVNHNTIYAGYSDVWKSTNKGNSWTKISTMSSSQRLRSMAIAPSNNSVLYVADNSHIWKTTNGGSSWSNITSGIPVTNSDITYIAIKATDPNTVWVSLSGFNSSTIYKTTNAGSNWSSISSGLPSIPAYSIVQDKSIITKDVLYVGTELGVYIKDGVNNWVEYNTALPKVRIGELEIYYDDNNSQNNKLRAASYGRGLWEVDLLNANNSCYDFVYKAAKTENILGSYTDLGTNGSVISTSNNDNANSAATNIGFYFKFNCDSFNQFILNTNGFVKLGNTAPSTASLFFSQSTGNSGGLFNSANPADVNLLSIFNHDLEGGTNPEYRVYTSGTAPNRVCTIQFEGVKEKTTTPSVQYSNLEFQIKLYETTNIIEYVYGNWTPSSNASAYKSAACGIKGGSNLDSNMLVVSKSSGGLWSGVIFQDGNYPSGYYGLNFGNPPARPKPTAGRTYRFVPTYDNDLKVSQIYALSNASLNFSNPQTISVNIMNTGKNNASNIEVVLNISGNNTLTDTVTVSSLNSGDNIMVSFASYNPSVLGNSVISVSVPSDDYNGDNSLSWNQNVSPTNISYTSSNPPNNAYGYSGSGSGIFATKMHIQGTAVVDSVKVFIYNASSNNVGQVIFGVVLDSIGNIIGQSLNDTIQVNDLNSWHSFAITTPPTIVNSNFMVGLAVKPSINSNPYYTACVQREEPNRLNTYYHVSISGGIATAYDSTFGYRFMQTAVTSGSVTGGIISANPSSVCMGDSAILSLTNYYGSSIQWQESSNSTSWSNVNTGTGSTTSTYTTDALTSLNYYRAKVNNGGSSYAYSDTIMISINPSYSFSESNSVCYGSSYTFPDNTTQNNIISPVSYVSYLQTISGCDSLITTNLSIIPSSAGVDIITACDSYTWIDGTTYTSSNNTATDTLVNALGCDSIVTLNLTINQSDAVTDVLSACDSLTWIDGITYTSSNNTASVTLTNVTGCDSVITLNLTINVPDATTDVLTACDSLTWIDGITYTSSNNTASVILTNSFGCDSVVTLDLTITTIDVSVTENGITLTATATGVNYQWIDCSNNSIIVGAVNQSYTAIANGDYAVIISNGSCADTSICYSITGIGIDESEANALIQIYPNPAKKKITIEGEGMREIEVVNSIGQKVKTVKVTSDKFSIDMSNLARGVYLIHVITNKGIAIKKIVLE